jgi:hypothetical protein
MHDFKDKDYPVPQLTEEERLAKGRQYGKRLAQISQPPKPQPSLSPAQPMNTQRGTNSVN